MGFPLTSNYILKVEVAVFGNHEFDFGVDHARDVTNEMGFPWLLGNVTDNFTGYLLGGGGSHVVVRRKNGLKVFLRPIYFIIR